MTSVLAKSFWPVSKEESSEIGALGGAAREGAR